MTYTLSPARSSGGFALPTVLIASVVMLTILIAAVGASSSVRTSLDQQYYNQLAREASESGVARARECLEKNGYIPQWTSNPATQLRPGTPCTGGPACVVPVPSCFVVSSGNVRTTFSVGLPDDLVISQVINVTAKVELLRKSNSAVWQTYTNTLSARVGNDIDFNTVSFGYYDYQYPWANPLIPRKGAHFLAIAADGTVKAVGDNKYGQLGNGTTTTALTPTDIVGLPPGFRARNVYTGFLSQGSNTYIISTAGDVYGFGDGTRGQLGNNSSSDQSTPVRFQLPGGKLGSSVTVNGKNTFVLTQDGDIYASGACWFGSLGTNYFFGFFGIYTLCFDRSVPARVVLPAYVAADLNTHPTSDIAADGYTAYVRMEGGRVYGWGNNQAGQLARDYSTLPATSTPVQISNYGDPGQYKAIQLAFDGETLYVLAKDPATGVNRLDTIGANTYGQLGDGTTTSSFVPLTFPLPPSAGMPIKVTTDQSFVSVLGASGEVWSAGLNDAGQLGNASSATIQATPVKFKLPPGVRATDIYSASLGDGKPYNNTFVVGDDGNIYGAGRNDFGQLGNGTTTGTAASDPVKMTLLPLGVKGLSVKTGFGTTVILTTSHKLYTVGNNSDGQLGDGTTTNSSIPKANPYVNVLPANYY